jgi:hypothetical protein
MAVNRRSKAINEVIYNWIFSGHFEEFIFLIVIEVYSSHLSLKSIFLQNSKRNQINISIEDRFKIGFDSLHFDRLSSINPHYLYSISRSDSIYIVIIAYDRQRMRSLPFRYKFR